MRPTDARAGAPSVPGWVLQAARCAFRARPCRTATFPDVRRSSPCRHCDDGGRPGDLRELVLVVVDRALDDVACRVGVVDVRDLTHGCGIGCTGNLLVGEEVVSQSVDEGT